MHSTPAPISPLVEVGAPEEELAPTTVLVDGDRTLGGKLPQSVAVDAEVLGCGTRVQPLAGLIVRRAAEVFKYRGCHVCRELVEQGIKKS